MLIKTKRFDLIDYMKSWMRNGLLYVPVYHDSWTQHERNNLFVCDWWAGNSSLFYEVQIRDKCYLQWFPLLREACRCFQSLNIFQNAVFTNFFLALSRVQIWFEMLTQISFNCVWNNTIRPSKFFWWKSRTSLGSKEYHIVHPHISLNNFITFLFKLWNTLDLK